MFVGRGHGSWCLDAVGCLVVDDADSVSLCVRGLWLVLACGLAGIFGVFDLEVIPEPVIYGVIKSGHPK